MKTISLSVLCLALCAVPAIADTTIGAPASSGNGNCFPFGCNYSGDYQQVYDHSLFSGPMTISGLEFYNTQFNFGATGTPTGTFTFSLSTTSADWNTLSSTFANNLGGDNTTVFSGSIAQPWSFGDTLQINFSTPYTYNPGLGNLLLDVNSSGSSASSGAIFFDVNGDGSLEIGRGYNGSGNPANGQFTQANYGLVTTFDAGSSPVPEPSSFLLLGSGLLAAAGVLRRKIMA